MGLLGDILAVPFEIVGDICDTVADVLEDI